MADADVARKRALKEMLTRLHHGANPDELKTEFAAVLAGVDAALLTRLEEELVHEGTPPEELRHLCDIHIALFRDELEKHAPSVPPDHPLAIFMAEHRGVAGLLARLTAEANRVSGARTPADLGSARAELNRIADQLLEFERHNQREENVLFPYLERHGITQPPAIMWAEHNELRTLKKRLRTLLEQADRLPFAEFQHALDDVARRIVEMLQSHIYKENSILYPAGLRVLGADEWRAIARECDELDAGSLTPRTTTEEVPMDDTTRAAGAPISFPTGALTREELEALLNTLPVDITFVGADDTVRYFSASPERIFVRTRAVIGRAVQNCHPAKSVHVVNQILADFRAGKRDRAEFWLPLGERFVYIRYFAVRSPAGAYLGCLEVSQDIAPIRKIEGTRTLLD